MRNLEKEHQVDKNQHQPFDLNNLQERKNPNMSRKAWGYHLIENEIKT
jgi:hypothetical protein